MEISICNLTKNYKDKVALNGVSFKVKKGEIFGLLGANGAGKTTLIKIASTLLKQTSGEVIVGGFNTLKEADKIREIINVCPQETAIAQNLTVKENFEFFAGVYNVKNAKEKINELVSDFSLGQVINKKARHLSGGYKRKLCIALSLINSPKILFLDEPTLGLDVIARKELWQIISTLKEKQTVILTTHYMEEANFLCDRVAILNEGNLIALGAPTEIIKTAKKGNFEDAFVALITESKV